MERIRLFKYFSIAGATYILPAAAFAHVIDNNWSRYPWLIVVVPMVAGTLAGTWAIVLKGKSFGIKKGVLTTFLSFITFNGLFGIYLEGFNIRALWALLGYTFFLGIGTMFMLFWIIPIGAIAGGMYEKRSNKACVAAQENIPIKGNRTVLWYLKFLFACYAAASATMVLLGVLSLPFAGYAGLEAMFSPESGLYLLIAGLVWSPLVFRYLK